MELQQFIQLIKVKRKTVLGSITLFMLIATVAIAFQTFKYSSDSQLLVIQERQGVTVDAYTASKSSEHLSRVLASVVTSNSFFNKVITTSPTLNTGYFGSTPKEQIKQWRKTVSAKNVNDTGIISISVYHPDKTEAEKIAGAVNYVLMTQHSAYDGAGDVVKLRLIDQPVTSSYPVNPNIPMIGGLAILLGFVTSLIYIYLLGEDKTPAAFSLPLEKMAAYEPHRHKVRPTSLPEEIFAQTHQERTERPSFSTPYGQRASVTLQSNEVNEYGIDPAEMIKPEKIFQQGNMKNILD
jgi:capsular polysaccharide biosynthesis protein